MEILTLGLFCGALLLCIFLKLSVLYALAAGLLIFLSYGRKKGFGWAALGKMSLEGILKVKNILITFVLIGMLTALWRAAGTIPVLVSWGSRLIRPGIVLLMSFLLNCLVSVLTGTAFGTAATMGVICAGIAAAMHINMLLAGGAVLSGAFFGDRCSPVSTSALLVSELTETDIFDNIKHMIKTAALPFALSCAVYTALGFFVHPEGAMPNLQGLFSREFNLHWAALLPAGLILLLALFRVNVKLAMSASILSALPVCLLLQHTEPLKLPLLMLMGYHSSIPELSLLIDGGGIMSMLRVGAIVCLSASYSGIFQQTGLLDGLRRHISALAEKTTPYAAMLFTCTAADMLSCNQTLSVMLSHQLCADSEENREELALDLEDSAVVTAALVPWSISAAVPLASVSAPTASILLAVYLWLLPLWRLIWSFKEKRRRRLEKAA